MASTDVIRPLRLDVGKHCHDLVVVKHAFERRHPRLVVRQVRRDLHANLCDVKEKSIVVMPGVPGCVVRWCEGKAFRVAALPVLCLTFQRRAVTGSAMDGVQLRAYGNDRGIVRLQDSGGEDRAIHHTPRATAIAEPVAINPMARSLMRRIQDLLLQAAALMSPEQIKPPSPAR